MPRPPTSSSLGTNGQSTLLLYPPLPITVHARYMTNSKIALFEGNDAWIRGLLYGQLGQFLFDKTFETICGMHCTRVSGFSAAAAAKKQLSCHIDRGSQT